MSFGERILCDKIDRLAQHAAQSFVQACHYEADKGATSCKRFAIGDWSYDTMGGDSSAVFVAAFPDVNNARLSVEIKKEPSTVVDVERLPQDREDIFCNALKLRLSNEGFNYFCINKVRKPLATTKQKRDRLHSFLKGYTVYKYQTVYTGGAATIYEISARW